jgi:hypothetical protein
MVGRIANKDDGTTFEARPVRRISGHWGRPSLAALIILFLAIVAVQKFDISPEGASISAVVGIAVAGLWLI